MNFRGALLVGLAYLVLPLYQVVDYVASQPFAEFVDNLNYAASIVAYDWLLLNVLIGLKVPVLQRAFPYDLRIRVHVWTTVGITVFLAWHAGYYLAVKVKDIDLVSWSLMAVFSGLVALSLLWIPFPGLKALRARLLGLVKTGVLKSYDWLKATHKLLFFVLAALTYVHILGAKLIGVASPVASFAYQALFAVTVVVFVWTRVHNLLLPTLEVRSVIHSGGIVRLALSGHPRLRYRSGQFAFLRFPHPRLKDEEHPFSFTSAGHEDGVGFAVRALGDFTSRLVHLRPGDKVRVNGGFGAFHPAPGPEPLALIGSGIGTAPLVSILKEVAIREPRREVVCLLSVNRREELVEAEALATLPAAMPGLKLRIFVFEEDGQLYDPGLFARELGDASRYRYYLCSSDKVRTIVVDALKTLGVKQRKIHFEAFNLG